jgi:hypothetical protein
VIDPLRPVQPGLEPVQPPIAPQRTARERREEDVRRRRGREADSPDGDEAPEEDDGLPHIDVRA